MRYSILLFFALSIAFSSCLSMKGSYPKLSPGIWRGNLALEPYVLPVQGKKDVTAIHENFLKGQLPFNFEVTYAENGQDFYIDILNGKERIRCDSVAWGTDRRTAMDTMRIYFPLYQSYISVRVRERLMEGEFVVASKDNYKIPFKAKMGVPYRFTNLNIQPEADLSGNWAAYFGEEKEAAIAEFKQIGNHLEGTFRTETGDYRFLEGTVQGNKFWLSTFDGAHAFLFSGKMVGDSLIGEFLSGTHYRTFWTAVRDANFKLGDADQLTKLKAGASPIRFEKKTPDGRTLTFPSAQFDKKIKIFTIAGTWCPNCYDEQVFLKKYLETHPEQAKNIQVVTFFFERGSDEAKINAHLAAYKAKMDLPWEVVYAGDAKNEIAQAVFPALEHVLSFPTMMVLDEKNEVRQIHTGFDGPATSKYEDYVKSFEALVAGIL